MYNRCAESLARHAAEVLKAMGGLEAEKVDIAVAAATDGPRHPLGVKVEFEGLRDRFRLHGFFICAFEDLVSAKQIASAISVKLGLGAGLAADADGVDDVLAEYLNTVIGLTCSDWALSGLAADFDPPLKLAERSVELPSGSKAFHLTVSVRERPSVPIFLVFLPASVDASGESKKPASSENPKT